MSQLDVLALNFDEAFSAPGGMKRLRELILTLAMQGKLVEQDESEGTADDLLREIAAEKKRLVQAGKIKAPKPLPAIEPEEAHHELPQNWQWARFGQLVDVLNGRAYKQNELLESGTPVLRVGNLFTSNKWYYSDLELDDDKYIDNGDLIYAWSASFGPFIWSGTKVIYHYHIWKLRFAPEGKPLKEFLYHFLNQQTESIKQSGNGIAMLHMTKERMELLLVPLPPLAEQRRIVARIDQLMARCDELEALRAQQEHKRVQVHRAVLREITADNDPAEFRANWQFLAEHFGELHATPQNVTELRSAVLQLAVMGKLVPQDPNEGTAAELLTQIAAEKKRLVAEGKIKTPKPLPPVSEAEQPYQVPQGWAWVRMNELFAITGGIQKTPKRAPSKNAFPYLGVSNVQRGYLNLSEVKEFELFEDELEKYHLQLGDLMVVEGNGSESEIGRSAIWNGEIENCVHQNHLIRCRPVLAESVLFVQAFLNSLFGMAEMKRLAVTTSGLYTLSVGKIQSIPIPLPPLNEQRRVLTKLGQLMALCDALELRLKERTVKQGELLSALMAELAPTLSARRPVVASRARGQAPIQVAAVPGAVGERRGRGRPRKEASTLTSSPARSIPEASSVEEAIRRLEARKAERATGSRQVGLFDEDN